MLMTLRIENFAIVSQLELDFSRGMTAFTGETGAGKSIMIDALMLALGGRADTSVIRAGAEKCDIHASFHVDVTSAPFQWLLEHDGACDTGDIILRRVLSVEGRSKSYINGQLFPVQKVKELSEMLVDIHGQHQHQTLLQHATHRQQLDQYAGHQPLQDAVASAWRACEQSKRALQALKNQEAAHDRLVLLRYQLDELDSLALKQGEMEALHHEHQLLHHARDYLEHIQYITDLLSAEDQPNIAQRLHHVLHKLEALPQTHPSIKNAVDLITSACIQCEEALDAVMHFAEQVQLDPVRLNEVEARIGVLHQAARKYHVDADQLMAHVHFLQEEVRHLLDTEKDLAALQQQYAQQRQVYEEAANALRESRKIHAHRLAEEISACIQQLGMPKGYVVVEVSSLEGMQVHGSDKVEYKVCTNPGMLPDTLAKVASGGELSRIGLAIQMITAQRGATFTLLFDEVDVGIGGATAALVGQLLRKLGERLQLFCVTHQPQVASCAHHHFVVEKYSDNEQTFLYVNQLVDNDKVNEIARMLGGLTITDQTRLHARELLIQSCAQEL